LWRGEAYEGLRGPREIGVEAFRLDELRLNIMERLFDTELALGHHAGIVTELSTAITQNPLREEFCAQLMLAYYRSGRQADAMMVYRDARRTLVEELGVEPGPELRKLERDILSQDPGLDAHVTASVSSRHSRRYTSMPRPMEVPPDLTSFTGRIDETASLVALLTEPKLRSTTVVSVSGAGGVGKSALAGRVAHIAAGHFPGGLFYVNLRGATPGLEPLAPAEALARLLRSLGLGGDQIPSDTDEAAARFRSLTAHHRVLVVLDDATDPSQVRPLLPGGSGNAALVTSRRVLAALDGAHHVHLEPLSEADALELLGELVGQERVRRQPAAAHKIVRLCGRLPLAVRVAGARLAARPDWDLDLFAERLTDSRRRLDELRSADLEIRSSFSISRAGLDAKVVQMFELLGLAEVDEITVPLAAAVGGTSVTEAQAILDELVEAQLLEAHRPGRYALHDLMRLYARSEAIASTASADRLRAIRGALHHYLGTARNALRTLATMTEPRLTAGVHPEQITVPVLGFKNRGEAIRWVDAESANLLRAVRQAATIGDCQDIVVGIAATVSTLFKTRGYMSGLVTINRLAIEAAEQICDQHSLAQAYNDLAAGIMDTVDLDDALAYAERALALWRQLGFRVGEAQTLNLLAVLLARKAESDKALSLYHHALEIRRELGHSESQAAILTNIGCVLRDQGKLNEALVRFEAALVLYRAEGLLGGEGFALGNIGRAHQLLGLLEQSVRELERAIDLTCASGQRRFEAEFRWYLGESLYTLGRRVEASACWREVVTDLHDSGILAAADAEALLREPKPRMPHWLR
jgi:tetratricopeptide (TPR) repeat protein